MAFLGVLLEETELSHRFRGDGNQRYCAGAYICVLGNFSGNMEIMSLPLLGHIMKPQQAFFFSPYSDYNYNYREIVFSNKHSGSRIPGCLKPGVTYGCMHIQCAIVIILSSCHWPPPLTLDMSPYSVPGVFLLFIVSLLCLL